jgi:hypothetical protein
MTPIAKFGQAAAYGNLDDKKIEADSYGYKKNL